MSEMNTFGIAHNELKMALSATNSLSCHKDLEQVGEREIMRDLRHALRHAENAYEYLSQLRDLVVNREV